MDHAVALVQAYPRVNGYFTVSEYPVIEARREGGFQAATDLDILGVRFPGAGRQVIRHDTARRRRTRPLFAPDPALGIPGKSADMLIGEVKEGRAELNRASRDPAVLEVVLRRFGCCPHAHTAKVIQQLLDRGSGIMPSGHHVRLIAFGSAPPASGTPPYQVLLLGHVTHFLQEYIRQYWEILRHTQSKDPAFGFLLTLEKASRGLALDES